MYKYAIFISILWILTPYVMCKISKEKTKQLNSEKLNSDQKKYVVDVAKRTWTFFDEYLNEENNSLK